MEKAYLQRKRQYGELAKWIDMDAFLMALRLRKCKAIYPDVEELFGEIILALVKTATRMLLHDEPRMRIHQSFLLSADSQQQLVLLLLEQLDKVDATRKSHLVFAYIKNIVQSRARNLVRDAHAAKRDTRATERFEDLEVHPQVADFWGNTVKVKKTGKITNTKKDFQ